MKAEKLCCREFRNLKEFEFQPCDDVNVICGDNAQGKTNLLEALWLFTGGRSFRGSKDSELIRLKSGMKAKLNLDFFTTEREQTARIEIFDKKEFYINEVKKSRSEVIGTFCAVVFSPTHLSLVKSGPEERRKFIDAAICQAKPSYAAVLSKYSKALKQRNSLLKDMKYSNSSAFYDLLDVWEHELIESGAAIIHNRLLYLERLSKEAEAVYEGISGGKEQLFLKYLSQNCEYQMKFSEICDIIKCNIKASREKDVLNGYSSVGPHRDDIEILINGISARNYGSQGQQRSCVLALKLAEAFILDSVIGEKPVALLDDVMSELDVGRQDYLLNKLRGYQVFITCCDPAPLMRFSGGKAFEMKDGFLSDY